MYRAVIFNASGLQPMRHCIAESVTPERAFALAAEEFFGSHDVDRLTWQPATGVVYYDGNVPIGCVWEFQR